MANSSIRTDSHLGSKATEFLVGENRMVLARACDLEKQGAVGLRFKVPVAQEETRILDIWDWQRADFHNRKRSWKAKLE